MRQNDTSNVVTPKPHWDTTTDRLYTIRKYDNWMIKRSGNQHRLVVWRMDEHELGPAWCEVDIPEPGERSTLASQIVDTVRGPKWLIEEVEGVMNGWERNF